MYEVGTRVRYVNPRYSDARGLHGDIGTIIEIRGGKYVIKRDSDNKIFNVPADRIFGEESEVNKRIHEEIEEKREKQKYLENHPELQQKGNWWENNK